MISLDWCFFGGKSLIKIWQWLWDRLGLLILLESLVFSSPLCAKVQEGPLFLVSSQSRLSPSDLGFTCRDVFCHCPTLSKPWLVPWLHNPQAAGPKVEMYPVLWSVLEGKLGFHAVSPSMELCSQGFWLLLKFLTESEGYLNKCFYFIPQFWLFLAKGWSRYIWISILLEIKASFFLNRKSH